MDVSAQKLVTKANEMNLYFGFVESLTGGLVSSLVTEIPGSSKVFKGAVVSYVDEIKSALIGVGVDALNTYTAVSEEVALQMAAGGLKILGVDLCVSMTGYAGPEAPAGKLGLVYIGIYSSRSHKVEKYEFSGSRKQIREKCANQAIALAVDYIEKELR